MKKIIIGIFFSIYTLQIPSVAYADSARDCEVYSLLVAQSHRDKADGLTKEQSINKVIEFIRKMKIAPGLVSDRGELMNLYMTIADTTYEYPSYRTPEQEKQDAFRSCIKGWKY